MNAVLLHVTQSIFASILLFAGAVADEPSETAWTKHTIFEGEGCMTAVAADYTGDGVVDVVADTGSGVTRLFLGPDWKVVQLDDDHGGRYIHSETWDVDGDGDADYIGARYNPGLIMWYEQPDQPLTQPWKRRLIDDQVHGIHGVIKGDVDLDGRIDLLATSAQPLDPFPDSLAWIAPPKNVRSGDPWVRDDFCRPRRTRTDSLSGSGRCQRRWPTGRRYRSQRWADGQIGNGGREWFAWWEAPKNPREAWKKHSLPGHHPGATNIHPADINGDGKVDLLASRGHGNGVIWFEAPSWKIHTIDAEIKEPHCLAVHDIDGDGDMDAATCAYGSKLCVWYENAGNGKFVRHIVGRESGGLRYTRR